MIPNILTTVRLVIIPFFAYFMLNSENFLVPLLLFVLSGVTDIVDGWIARQFNMITDVGSVYDPLVDKLMQITAVVCLSLNGTIPGWVICVVAVKELSMIAVGVVLYIKKIVVHSNWYGKAATVFFYAVMFVFIIFPAIDEAIKTVLLAALVVVMFAAAIGYLVKISGAEGKSLYNKKA
ncbi:MAG: CDP-diacylglycerol--glycerol-3-phosphate 3-phosphatidyltransferase [Ruminococcaceae bacterium]|nr:CDP-diacylglycerol--glycerol-3-phosphate 3-phosphatidyltransferase [Oscillospiraceae bacterium]